MKTRKRSAECKSHSNDLLDTLDWAFNVASWHGPNLAGSIKGLRAEDAAWAQPGRKSIWQQTLHAAYWKQRVLNKLIGTQPFPRAGSNWPKLRGATSMAPSTRQPRRIGWKSMDCIRARARTSASASSTSTAAT